MRTAAVTTCADSGRFFAKRERNIGVSGGEPWDRLDVQVSVNGANDFQDARVIGKFGGRTVADGLDGEAHSGFSTAMRERLFAPGFMNTLAQALFQPLKFQF